MTDETSIEETQKNIDESAISPGYEFHGIKLHPFSFDRNACFQRCGYETWSGQLESQFESLTAIVFFCTLGTELVDCEKQIRENVTNRQIGVQFQATGWDMMDECRGAEKIKAMRKRVGQWMDLHGVNANSEDGKECYRIGVAIWNDMEKTRFRAIPDVGNNAPPPNV